MANPTKCKHKYDPTSEPPCEGGQVEDIVFLPCGSCWMRYAKHLLDWLAKHGGHTAACAWHEYEEDVGQRLIRRLKCDCGWQAIAESIEK